MGVALGWVALALAVVGAPDGGRGGAPIKYTVRFIEVEGLGWRDAVFSRLTPVTRQGAATVWTAPSEVAKRMVACASKSPSSHMIQAPTVTAWSGATAHITTRSNRQLVTQVAWSGEDRSVRAKPETVRTGSAATMAGRKLDQGVLVQLVLQDTQILAVHHVALGGPGAAPSDPSAKKAAYHGETSAAGAACCSSASNGSSCDGDSTAKVAVDVPEIGSQEIAGEWLVPKDGVLLVSFGPHTVADKDGKAVIRERLAIVEADEADGMLGAPAAQPPAWRAPAINVPILPAPAAMAAPAAAMTSPSFLPATAAPAMPPMPSRSTPQGYHTDGKAAELPPLPPDEADDDDDDDSSGSAEARPSPQMKKPRNPGTARASKPSPPADAAMKKVQFSISNFQSIPTLFQPAPAVGLQFLLPIKPVSFKLPFNRRLEVEIYGRVVRAPEPARSSADLATKPRESGTTTTK